jgi:hypothetical protein
MEKFALVALLVLGLWVALKVAKFFVRLVMIIAVIIIAVVGYYMYMR